MTLSLQKPVTDRRPRPKKAAPSRPKKDVENDTYAEFLDRAIRAYARRVGRGDIEALPQLVELRKRVDDAITDAVAELRSERWAYSWGDIARVLSITPQTAFERWRHVGGVRRPGGQPSHLR